MLRPDEDPRDRTAALDAHLLPGLLAQAFAETTDLLLITDAEGTIMHVNSALESLSGWTAAQAVGKNVRELLFDHGSPDILRGICGPSGDRAPRRMRASIRCGGGGGRVVDATICPVLDQDHGSLRYVVVGRDVTDENMDRRSAVLAEKMDAVGRLISGVAHDLNNHLTVIETGTRFALQAAEPDSQLAEDILEIQEAGRRVSELVARLRALNRERAVAGFDFDLGGTVRGARDRITSVLGEAIDLTIDTPDDELLVRADPTQLEQVVLILAANAADAMPEGGALTIAVGVVAESSDPALGRDGPTTAVSVTVSDTGCGIAEPDINRIFEPFFTTKPDRSGLGLSTAYGLTAGWGGTIEVESDVGRGTTVTIILPATDAPR